MYFDDYSTSFQSLYKPMYNLQPGNVTAAAGATGATGVTNGVGAGMVGGYMGGYNTPMAQVGIGQFGPDQLVKNNEQKNNYYARPIAAHKVKDETPMILGIIGTALGTAALLLALKKGKKVTPTPVPPTPTPPVPTPPAAQRVMGNNFAKAPNKAKSFEIDPNSIRYAGGKKGPKPGPNPGPTPPAKQKVMGNNFANPPYKANSFEIDPNSIRYAGGKKGPTPGPQPGPTPPDTQKVMGNNFANPPYKANSFEIDPNSIKYAGGKKGPSTPDVTQSGNLPTVAPKYINPNTQGAGYVDRIASPEAIQKGLNRPYSPIQNNGQQATQVGNMGLLPGGTGNTPAGLLGSSPINVPATIQGNGSTVVTPNQITIGGVPAKNKVSFAQDLRQRAIDTPFEEVVATALPYNGQKVLPGATLNQTALPVSFQKALPGAQQNMPVLAQQAAQTVNIKGYLPTQQESILTKVNNNLGTIRPDMQANGSIVRTTHTLETFANGYSIGANAKGADKLAALRAQLAQG